MAANQKERQKIIHANRERNKNNRGFNDIVGLLDQYSSLSNYDYNPLRSDSYDNNILRKDSRHDTMMEENNPAELDLEALDKLVSGYIRTNRFDQSVSVKLIGYRAKLLQRQVWDNTKLLLKQVYKHPTSLLKQYVGMVSTIMYSVLFEPFLPNQYKKNGASSKDKSAKKPDANSASEKLYQQNAPTIFETPVADDIIETVTNFQYDGTLEDNREQRHNASFSLVIS